MSRSLAPWTYAQIPSLKCEVRSRGWNIPCCHSAGGGRLQRRQHSGRSGFGRTNVRDHKLLRLAYWRALHQGHEISNFALVFGIMCLIPLYAGNSFLIQRVRVDTLHLHSCCHFIGSGHNGSLDLLHRHNSQLAGPSCLMRRNTMALRHQRGRSLSDEQVTER